MTVHILLISGLSFGDFNKAVRSIMTPHHSSMIFVDENENVKNENIMNSSTKTEIKMKKKN